MKTSLRRRLILILLMLMLFAWAGSALVTGLFAGRVMMGQVDRQLEQYSDMVAFITGVFSRQ